MTERFVGHFDACLGCMACVTACPSGVEYGPLIEDTRAQIERRFPRSAGERLFRKAIFMLVPYPRRMRLALLPAVLYRRIQPLLARSGLLESAAAPRACPGQARAAGVDSWADGADSWPDAGVGRAPPDRWPADRVRAAAGLLTRQRGDHPRARGRGLRGAGATCARLLRRAGGPRGPPRRGTRIRTAHYRGLRICRRRARGRQRCGMRVVDEGVRPAARRTIRSGRSAPGLSPPGSATSPSCSWSSARHERRGGGCDLRVAYHDACHLAHAQGIRAEPRELLRQIPGVELVPFAEGELCCGSAGIYNLLEPEPARQLGRRKLHHITDVRPDVIATANPGCTLQLLSVAAEEGTKVRVVHPIELIDEAIRAASPPVR